MQDTELPLLIMSPKALLATLSQAFFFFFFLNFYNLNLRFLLTFLLFLLVFRQSARPGEFGRTVGFGGEAVMCVKLTKPHCRLRSTGVEMRRALVDPEV